MDINLPDVLAEVQAQFVRYQTALTNNGVAVLDELFWNSPHTLRYGTAGNLYDYDDIRAFRAARSALSLERRCPAHRPHYLRSRLRDLQY